ncbi:MAG TPA: hypothetical protein VF808_17105 [Ktedonobacterales bacterium]
MENEPPVSPDAPGSPPHRPQPVARSLVTRFIGWFRAQRGANQIAYVMLAFVAVFFACAFVYAATFDTIKQARGAQVIATATPTATYPPIPTDTIGPTVMPFPTVTSAPQGPPPPSGAVLGGPVDAFVNRYGVGVNIETWDIDIDGRPIQLMVQSAMYSRGDIVSADTQDRVWTFGLTYTNSSPGVSVVARDCARFLPQDAIHVKDIQQPYGPTHLIYQSGSVASAFTASSFVDGASQWLPPGTFTVVTTGASCDVLIGE